MKNSISGLYIKMVVGRMHSHEKYFVQVFYYFLFKISTFKHVELAFHFNLLTLCRIFLFSLRNGMSDSKGVWPQHTH